MNKAKSNNLPNNLSTLFTRIGNNWGYTLRNNDNFSVKYARTTQMSHCLSSYEVKVNIHVVKNIHLFAVLLLNCVLKYNIIVPSIINVSWFMCCILQFIQLSKYIYRNNTMWYWLVFCLIFSSLLRRNSRTIYILHNFALFNLVVHVGN